MQPKFQMAMGGRGSPSMLAGARLLDDLRGCWLTPTPTLFLELKPARQTKSGTMYGGGWNCLTATRTVNRPLTGELDRGEQKKEA